MNRFHFGKSARSKARAELKRYGYRWDGKFWARHSGLNVLELKRIDNDEIGAVIRDHDSSLGPVKARQSQAKAVNG